MLCQGFYSVRFTISIFLSLLISAVWLWTPAIAQLGNVENRVLTLTNGLEYQGQIFESPKLDTTWGDIAAGRTQMPILIVDDGLRRTCMSDKRRDIVDMAVINNPPEEITVYQHSIDRSGNTTTPVGNILWASRFDEWGRREVRINDGSIKNLMQGITRITPTFCEVEVLQDNLPNTPKKEWNMRIATTSVPADVLNNILMRQVDPDNFDDRLSIAEFFVQAKRYQYAEAQLAKMTTEFEEYEEELLRQYELVKQAHASWQLNEIRQWYQGGNIQLANDMLSLLENRPKLSSETLAEISQLRSNFNNDVESIKTINSRITTLAEAIDADTEATAEVKDLARWIAEEVETNLNLANRNRLASFMRLQDDESLSLDQKLALAISGWIIGATAASDNFALAESLTLARPLVKKYLNAAAPDREVILEQLAELEAGHPEYLSKIVALMRPPVETDLSGIRGPDPLTIEFTVGTINGPQTYLAQLPPSYNPYRKYPCIVTLNSALANPLAQIGWWCQDFQPSMRMRRGLAARNSYIVIAPKWSRDEQTSYGFSVDEHAIVLGALRDAKRRFSIDSDRVFLTGHFSGADAAWDIGFSHPDLWAGVLPISPVASKYIKHYWKNVTGAWRDGDRDRNPIPLYFVYGERDYQAREANINLWNKYLTRSGNDTFVIEFKGRGSEGFFEESHRMFDWMDTKQRNLPDIRGFEFSVMRSTDRFFYWYEIERMKPESVIHPAVWDNTKRKSDWIVSSSIQDNRIRLRGDIGFATVYLSPEQVDFSRDIEIDSATSSAAKISLQPSTKTLLEDVRQRAERQHPFWAKVVLRDRRWSVEE